MVMCFDFYPAAGGWLSEECLSLLVQISSIFSTAVSTAVLMQSVLCKPYIEVLKAGRLDFGRLDCCKLWTVTMLDIRLPR